MSLRPPSVLRPRAPQRPEHGPAPVQNTRRPAWALAGVVLLALSVVAGLTVLRGTPEAVAPPVAVPGSSPRLAAIEPDEPADLDAVAALIDTAVTEAMGQQGIPGGVFVMVADGAIAYAQGYGHTDLDRQTPVDVARTRFDIGSVSKLLTATAVMQQVEQGTLDLHADVNGYLTALRVPGTFDEPVTAAHLLTHTAGFAEHLIEPVVDSTTRHLPPRIKPPGRAHQYSNHGAGLAGYLVESVSGEPFEDYVSSHILEPLGMTRSSYGRPVADAHDVTPHETVPGGTTAEVPRVAPSLLATAGLWTTGEDIAAFMLAHLQGGEHAGARILESDTVEAMQRTQFTPHPEVSGIGYGFFEHAADDRRGIQHGGSWVGASSYLYLLPDADVGFFLAFNHGAGVNIAHTLIYDAVDRLFPVTPRATAAPTEALDDVRAYAGQYRWNRHDRSTFMRLISTLMVNRLAVTTNDDGTVTTTMTPIDLVPDTTWTPTAPGVFVEEGGTNTLVFDRDDHGRVAGLHVAGAQLFSMDRLAWHETTGFVLTLLLTFLAGALIAAAGWPAGAIYGRLRRRHGDTPTGVRRARRLGGLAGGLLVAFLIGLVGHFLVDMGGLLQVGPAVRALLWLPLASVVLTAGLAFVVIRLWRTGEGSTAGRVYYAGVTLALLAFIPFLYHLRLLGFHY